MAGRMAPQRCPCLIPRIYEYVVLHGTQDFAGVIKVTGLNIGEWPGLSRNSR